MSFGKLDESPRRMFGEFRIVDVLGAFFNLNISGKRSMQLGDKRSVCVRIV